MDLPDGLERRALVLSGKVGEVGALVQCIIIHLIIMAVVITGLYNLSTTKEDSELWVAFVSGGLSSLCPSPIELTSQWHNRQRKNLTTLIKKGELLHNTAAAEEEYHRETSI